jgi:hypothetical protein
MLTLVFTALLAAATPVEVHTLAGDVVTGPILEFTGEQVTVEADGKRVSIPADKLAGLAASAQPAKPAWEPGVWVDLADGSSLVGADYAVQNGQAKIVLRDGKTIEMPTRDVVAVRMQHPNDAGLAEWTRIRDLETTSDLLVVRKESAIDYHRGVLRDVTESVVHFEADGERLPVKRAKVLGLIYFQAAGRQLPEAVCRVTDADDCSWAVRAIHLSGNDLQWTTPLGISVARPLTAVARVDFSRGKIVYLAELQPETQEWMPYFGIGKDLASLREYFAPKQNRSLDLGPLELGGKSYTKGLALRSRTRLVYRLPDKFGRLKAMAGIDDRVRPRGNARLVIQGDDRVLLETTLTGTEPPKPLDLDLTGVRRLTILVDYGEDLDVSDHVDLAEVRVLK